MRLSYFTRTETLDTYLIQYNIFFQLDDVPRTSTPEIERIPATFAGDESPIGGKHHLTPSSKQAELPKPKARRFDVGKSVLLFLIL